jgi:hypothetical protein
MKFEFLQKLAGSKDTFPKIFEIKYGWKEFEIRINFPYMNFSKFQKEFELKFRENSMGRT